MIESNIIKYRIGEYGRCKSVKCGDIARMAIKDSTIEIVYINGDLTKINLGFVAEEYVRVIKIQMARLAKEMNIRLN